jgi:3-oxoacyl-[acyl-carrier-protein] synthase-3
MTELVDYLLQRIAQAQQAMGKPTPLDGEHTRFGDVLDSMALVEFLTIVAEDCGVPVETLEQQFGPRFGSITEMAAGMEQIGLMPQLSVPLAAPLPHLPPARRASPTIFVGPTAFRLPGTCQPGREIDRAVGRPEGWLEERARIKQRFVWSEDEAIAAAVAAVHDCLTRADRGPRTIDVLLVTSEASPLLIGLGACLHHRLQLRPDAVVLEIGGACTGYLAALWNASALLRDADTVAIVSLESPSTYLMLQPGTTGETAALFGDAAAATLFFNRPFGETRYLVKDVRLLADGQGQDYLRLRSVPGGTAELVMDGFGLTREVMYAVPQFVRELLQDHQLREADLAAVVIHGGNGRFPGMLAMQLDIPEERVWSETYRTGNLGSASIPVAWGSRSLSDHRPVVWATVGAGLTFGVALLESAV